MFWNLAPIYSYLKWLYDPNGGGRKAAQADMDWYSAAGQLEGDPSTLNIEDFWYLKPLDAAMQ